MSWWTKELMMSKNQTNTAFSKAWLKTGRLMDASWGGSGLHHVGTRGSDSQVLGGGGRREERKCVGQITPTQQKRFAQTSDMPNMRQVGGNRRTGRLWRRSCVLQWCETTTDILQLLHTPAENRSYLCINPWSDRLINIQSCANLLL